MKSEKNKLKNILKSCAPLSYVIPLILFFIFINYKSNLLLFALISLTPAVYSLSFALIYGEVQADRGGTYRGYKAVIISFQHFWFFVMFGLWSVLIYLRIPINFGYGWMVVLAMVVYFLPLITIIVIEKKDKKSIPKMSYWIQTPDLNVTDGERALTLKEAQEFITNYQWEKEIFRKKRLERSKKETCPPTIGLDYQGQIFTISSTGQSIFDLHIDTGNDRRDIKNLDTGELFKLIDHYYNKEYDQIFGYFRLK